MSTSVPGQVHAVAWLELRTLLAWLGVGLDGAHLVMALLNAFAVVLVFHLATQLFGRPAGVAAVCIVANIGWLHVHPEIYNSRPLMFLGAVFVLACTAAVERPGMVSVGLAALVGAVMANVHLACVLTGASVVWVALLAPRRRFVLAAFGAALFALATFLVAPPSWLHNLTSLLAHRGPSGRATGVMPAQGVDLLRWALFALGAWAASLFSRAPAWVEYRRRSQGAFAVMVPFLAAFLIAPHVGMDADEKYLTHLKPACAIAAALPLSFVVSALLRRVLARLSPVARRVTFVVALVIAVPLLLAATANDERLPTVRDLVAVAGILHEEHGWDLSQMLENLKVPYGVAALTGLRALGTVGTEVRPVAADVGSSALLVMLATDDLPDPLPPTWKIVRRAAHKTLVLIVLSSRIDWSQFEVCMRPPDGPAPPCAESGLLQGNTAPVFNAPNMPPTGLYSHGTLRLRLPLRPAAPGSTDEIFMPRIDDVCGGSIASISQGGLRVDADRRHATLSAPDPGQASPSAIELEWQIGSPECDRWAYDGLPPFIIEGDAAQVRLLEGILRKREG